MSAVMFEERDDDDKNEDTTDLFREAPYKDGVSIVACVNNVCKTILGAGILTLSWAFYFSSLLPGIFFTCVMCLLSAHSFYVLGVLVDKTGRTSYAGIFESLFGERYAFVPDVATIAYAAMALVSYLIIIGDYIPKAIDSSAFDNRHLAILAVSALVSPFVILQDLSFLSYTSGLGFLGTLYTAAILLFELHKEGVTEEYDAFVVQPGVFVMIPAVGFAFNGHFNAPELYASLSNRTPLRWMYVTAISFTICLILTLAAATSGYLMLGKVLSESGKSNVLTSFDGRDEIKVAYVATSLSVALSIPLYVQGVRDSLHRIWERDLRKAILDDSSGSELDTALVPPLDDEASRGNMQTMSHRRRVSLSIGCLCAVLALSMAISDLGIVNSINGAVCASLLMFVLPSMMYVRVQDRDESGRGDTILTIISYASIAVGAIVAVTGITTSVMLAAGLSNDLRW